MALTNSVFKRERKSEIMKLKSRKNVAERWRGNRWKKERILFRVARRSKTREKRKNKREAPSNENGVCMFVTVVVWWLFVCGNLYFMFQAQNIDHEPSLSSWKKKVKASVQTQCPQRRDSLSQQMKVSPLSLPRFTLRVFAFYFPSHFLILWSGASGKKEEVSKLCARPVYALMMLPRRLLLLCALYRTGASIASAMTTSPDTDFDRYRCDILESERKLFCCWCCASLLIYTRRWQEARSIQFRQRESKLKLHNKKKKGILISMRDNLITDQRPFMTRVHRT